MARYTHLDAVPLHRAAETIGTPIKAALSGAVPGNPTEFRGRIVLKLAGGKGDFRLHPDRIELMQSTTFNLDTCITAPARYSSDIP